MLRRLTAISVILAAVGLGSLAPAAWGDFKGVPYGTLTLSATGQTVHFTLTLPEEITSFAIHFSRSTAAVDSNDNLISMSASGFTSSACAPFGGSPSEPGCSLSLPPGCTAYPTPPNCPTSTPTVSANTPITGQILMSHLVTGDSAFATAANANGNPVLHNTFLPVAQTHEVTLGSGSETSRPSKRKVPKVVGKSRASAERAIRKAGLKVGAVKRKHSRHAKKGDVISQSLSSGRSVAAGTRVGLVVSAGK